ARGAGHRVPTIRHADPRARDARRERLLVARRRDARGRPPLDLLDHVHLDRRRPRHRLRGLPALPQRRGPSRRLAAARGARVGGLAALAAASPLAALRSVRFASTRLPLPARGTESVDWEERILRSAGRSSFVALSTAGSLSELRQRVAAFEALDSVSEVESVL